MFSLFLCYNKEKTTLKKQTLMKTKIKKYLLLTLALIQLFGFFAVPQAQAFNQAEKCNNGVCTLLINDLPDKASKLPENTNVSLNFAIYKAGNKNDSNVCPTSNNLYYILKQYSSGSNYTYRSNGNGAAFTHNFNSGKAGQINNYEAFFYCDTAGLTTTQTNLVETRLSGLSSQNKVYAVTPFSMTTVSSSSIAPQIIFNPAPTNGSYAPNTTITITAQNLPANLGSIQCGQGNNPNYKMEIKVNGQKTTFFCFPYPLTIKTGAIEGPINMTGGSNNIEVIITEANGNPISLNNSTLSFKVSEKTVSNNTNPTASTNTFDCKNNFDPKKCIYNPLPEDELTNMFLFIAKGFLIITAIWGVMFIIIGGFRMVMAAGNEEDYIAAKKTITWAILGVVITMLSFSIIAIVQNILSVDVIDTVNEQQK